MRLMVPVYVRLVFLIDQSSTGCMLLLVGHATAIRVSVGSGMR